jgi:hypothetical protein
MPPAIAAQFNSSIPQLYSSGLYLESFLKRHIRFAGVTVQFAAKQTAAEAMESTLLQKSFPKYQN